MADETFIGGVPIRKVTGNDGPAGDEINVKGSELKIDNEAVTATAAELNILDGVTGGAADLNNAYQYHNGLLPITNELSNLVAAPFDPMMCTGTVTLTDAALYLWAVYIPEDVTLTGVAWAQTVQGDTTADNNNRIGLYTSDGTNLTLVASSADDGTLWESAAGIIQEPFSATYAATGDTVYWIGALANWSAAATAPQIAGLDTAWDISGISSVLPATTNVKQFSVITAQSDLPANPAWTSTVATTVTPWFGVY